MSYDIWANILMTYRRAQTLKKQSTLIGSENFILRVISVGFSMGSIKRLERLLLATSHFRG